MDTFQVTDEGVGIIRVDAQTTLMRRAMAEAICNEVDRVADGYDEFKILMNLGAISRGTPAAGWYTVRRLKQYPMTALALFRANRFMQGMAGVVLGLARFRSFALFDDEAEARKWLEAAPLEDPGRSPGRSRVVASAAAGGVLAVSWLALRRQRRPG